ncbi:DUF6677 family protein [Chlamydiota bacterium]
MNKRSPLVAYFLAWLIPGMGHFYYRKWAKAVVFFISILSLYFFGILLGGEVLWYDITFLSLLGFIAKFFTGIIFVLTVHLKPLYDNTAVCFEIGNAFLLMAGSLNMLILIDLFDELTGRKKQVTSDKEGKNN